MEKIRVLECIRQGKIGGGESHLLSLMEHINRDRFEPHVLSFTDGPMISRLKELNIPTTVIHTERPFDVFKWKMVRELLAGKRINLVHAHGTRAASNTMAAARKLGVPLIYTVHGWSFHPDQGAVVRRIRTMGEQYLTSRSAMNISVAKSNQETGEKMLRNFKSVVVNNGIDRQRFDPSRTFADIRAEVGIPPGALVIGFLARFTSHKQPLVLLEAFRRIAEKRPDAYLLMVGDGDQKDEAMALTAQWPERPRILFLPFRQDVPDVLAAMDIFVLPSLWEGLPIGLLEAMAMGKAVVVTNVDGSREVISNGENGLMAEAGSPDSVAGALEVLLADKALRDRLGKAARDTVTETYDAANMTRLIEAHYFRLVR